MTQSQFMYELMKAVESFPDEKKYTVMSDYDRYFSRKKESGLSDEDIIAALPMPQSIADGYRSGSPFPLDEPTASEFSEKSKGRAAPLGVFLFTLLVPVCAVYEVLDAALSVVAAVIMLALCVAAAFASVACFGVISLSKGFILLGIGGLLITAALVLFSSVLFRLLARSFGAFPRLMKRVLHNQGKGGAKH